MRTEQMIRPFKQAAITLLLLLGLYIKAQTQVYPVQVIPQLIAPYTAAIPDYYTGTTEKLVVSLINTDLAKPVLQVRLKMSIKSSSVNLVSRDDVFYPAITLDAGVTQRISLNDLAPYFDANNLIFQGITRAQYQQTRKLPEGFYQFCFEVYEYNTNRLVGRSNCAMAWINLLDPPLLNLPRKTESIAYKDPNNIIFQWTPRNMTSPTAAFNTEYEFTLVELWDNGIAPEAAFNSTQPLYRTTTQATTLLYGPSEPLLIPGKRYGWRIRAQASDGSQNSDAYRNNGYSEIYWFTYQRDCPTPFNVQSDVSGGRATITWSASVQQNRYTVDYREKNQSGSTWYTVNSTANRVMLYDLQKGKQYEYRVGGYCDIANGNFPLDGAVYSDIKSFALDGSTKDESLACSILQPELKIANRTPIQSLLSGEIITAGDFPVKLITVQGNGSFTGNGYITIPFIGKAAVKVRFSGITVNTDRQLIGGLIETTYDASEKQIVDVDTLINAAEATVIAGVGVGKMKTGEDSVNYTVSFDIPGNCSSCKFIPNDGSVINETTGLNNNANGGTIDFGDGNTLKTDTMPVTVKDKSGDIYKIERSTDGKSIVTTKIGNAGGADLIAKADKNKLDTEKGSVIFSANVKQQFAFDSYIDAYSKNSNWDKSFEKIGSYRVSAKAIAPGVTDVVTAIVTLNGDLDPDKVQFVNTTGTAYTSKAIAGEKGRYEITLVGGPANDAQEVYALYPQEGSKPLNLGKLLVASYAQTQLNVKLVPVNGATGFDSKRISDSLNAIYNPVNVKVNVTVAGNFDTDVFDKNKGLTVGGKNFFNVYSDDMKALNSAYASKPGIDKNTAYLFIVDRAVDGTVLGDMPRSKQFGYIFLQNNNDVEHTVAHEIGHGVFDLQHVFEYSGINQGTLPGNVMDYPAGGNLSKYQWDCLHAPALLAGVFDNNDDVKNLTTSDALSKELMNADGQTFTFITPAGEKVLVDNSITKPIFSYGVADDKDGINTLTGSLIAFTVKDKKTGQINTYRARFSGDGVFLAYENTKDNAANSSYPALTGTSECFILGLPHSTEYRIQKFDAADGLAYYTGQGDVANRKIVNEVNFDARLFTSNKLLAEQKLVYTNTVFTYSQISLATDELQGLEKCDAKPELLAVLKAIQIRHAYPALFKEFTAYFDNWNNISTTTYGASSSMGVPVSYPIPLSDQMVWDQKCLTDATLITQWKQDPVSYYQKFDDGLINFIRSRAIEKQNLLNAITINSTADQAYKAIYALSDNEINNLPYDKRLLLIRILASECITNTDNAPDKEAALVKLVQYIKSDNEKMQLAADIVTQKDSRQQKLLVQKLINENVCGLNGEDLVSFVVLLHQYGYKGGNDVTQAKDNKMHGRYFSFDPSFTTNAPITIDVKDNGKIQLAKRTQFTFWFFTNLYDIVQLDPYASVTLHFDDDKNTGLFTFKKDSCYTTSAVVAYLLLNKVIDANLKQGGVLVVQAAITGLSLGTLTAAVSSGTGILAATGDVVANTSGLVMEAGLRDKLMNTDAGKTFVNFYDASMLIYGSSRVTYEVYNLAKNVSLASKQLAGTFNQSEQNVIKGTEDAAENIIKDGYTGGTSVTPPAGQTVEQFVKDNYVLYGKSEMSDLLKKIQLGNKELGYVDETLDILGRNTGSADEMWYMGTRELPTAPANIPGGGASATAVQKELLTNVDLAAQGMTVTPTGQLIMKVENTLTKEIVTQVEKGAVSNATKYGLTEITVGQDMALVATPAIATQARPILLYATNNMVKVLEAAHALTSEQISTSPANAPVKEEESDKCTLCTTEPLICALQKKATYAQKDIALGKLCSQLTVVNLKPVCARLNTLSIADLDKFLADVNNTGTYNMANDIASVDVAIVNAWDLVNTYDQPERRSNMPLLKEVKDLEGRSNFMQTIGGINGLGDVIHLNNRAPYKGCTKCSATYLRNIDDYLKDVEYFVGNYTSKTNAGDVLDKKGIKNGSANQVEATAFILRVLSSDASLLSSISGFEEKIETINDDGEINTAFADITKVGNIFVECKSWKPNGMSFQKFVTGESGSYNQFKTYLSQINSLDELEYWFDGNKITGTDKEGVIREKFKALLFDENTNRLTPKGEEVFKVIWANPNLRQSLFGGRTEQIAVNYFTNQFTNSIESEFYKFIIIK